MNNNNNEFRKKIVNNEIFWKPTIRQKSPNGHFIHIYRKLLLLHTASNYFYNITHPINIFIQLFKGNFTRINNDSSF